MYFESLHNEHIFEKGVNIMFVTIPGWIWVIYYIFLIATAIIALYRIMVKKKKRDLVIIIVLFAVYILAVLSCIGRRETVTEIDVFYSAYSQGAIWTKIVILGYLCILIWWVLLIISWITKCLKTTNTK